MANAMIEKFIGEITLAKKPYVAYNTRIVCKGSLVVRVLPDLKSEHATSYRLELYKDITVENEFPFAVLFATSLLGTMVIRRIGGTLKKFFFEGVPFDRDINGFHLRAFSEDGRRVLLAEPIRGHPKQ